jgi:hypothetical protein
MRRQSNKLAASSRRNGSNPQTEPKTTTDNQRDAQLDSGEESA